MIDVAYTADSLTLRFRGLDVWASRTRHIHLTARDVLGADVRPASVLARSVKGGLSGVKLGRLGTVGLLADRDRRDHIQIWSVLGRRDVLVIETTLKRPHRIVFTHPDARALAAKINSRFLRGAVIPDEH